MQGTPAVTTDSELRAKQKAFDRGALQSGSFVAFAHITSARTHVRYTQLPGHRMMGCMCHIAQHSGRATG